MDELLQIERTEINVGLNKEYRFFQITDTHMAYVDNDSSQLDLDDNARCHKQWDTLKREFASEAGEHCDERYDVEADVLFKRLADHAVSFGADALILSGDIMDRVTDSNVRYLRQFIDSYPIPVVYCPGNHCWINEQGEHANFYDRLKPIIPNAEIDFYDFGELTVATVDDGKKIITDNQISALKEKIKEGKKILLVLHAPINLGEFGREYVNKMSPYFFLGAHGDCDNAFEFVRLIEENDDSFIAVLAGHIHRFAQGALTDKLMQYTTSSGLIGAGREIIIK